MKVVVITRHLQGCRPVSHSVRFIPNDVDDNETFANAVLDSEKEDFIRKFPEFEHSKWYFDILDCF